MKGTFKTLKDIKSSITEPLKALKSVLDGEKGVHIVYNFNKEGIVINAKNDTNSAFAVFNLDTSKVIDEYEVVDSKMGIYNVSEFISIFDKGLFNEDVNVSLDNGRLKISSGDAYLEYITSDVEVIKEGKGSFKNDDTIETVVEFNLSGKDLHDLKVAASILADHKTIIFSGSVDDNKINVEVANTQVKNRHSYKSVINGSTNMMDFVAMLPKSELEGLFSCNDTFAVRIHKKIDKEKYLGEFSYRKENYDMEFYVASVK